MKHKINTFKQKKLLLIILITYYVLVFVFGIRFLFCIPFLILCFKTGQLLTYMIIKSEFTQLNNTELFLFTFCTLNMGFAFLILFVKTNNYILMFHAIFQFLFSIFYLIKLNNRHNKQACTVQ